jgi:type II secretory pathway component PulF
MLSFLKPSQSQSLLRIIALAIEQRLPLAPLLRAFAEDQDWGQRWRVHRVAGLLEGGSSLPAALEQVARVLPEEDVLAIRFGTQSGTLPVTLRNLIEESDRLEDVRFYQPVRDVLPYVAVVLLVCVLIGAFLLINIVPVYRDLMRDIGVDSAAFERVTHVGSLIANYGWLAVGAGLLLGCILWTERPGRSLRRALFRPWCDMRSADVLRNLSVVAEAGRPIPGAISTLARYHHDSTLRQKLLYVRNEVEQGADLWITLRKVNLLTPAEVAVMEASQKVGNRPWAMAQLARCKRRRIRRRLELAGQLLEPVTVLLLGGVVLALFWSVLSPIVEILWHLT